LTDIGRIKELIQLLIHYRNEYYNNANSEVSDLEYDRLFDELKERIESCGGKVSGAVSTKTSYLINNNVSSSSGKNEKAKQLGVPIISENDLLKMIKS